MRYLAALFIGIPIFLVVGPSSAAEREVSFQWCGQGCFVITTTSGTVIVTDPVKMGAYRVPPDIKADLVTVSHEHGDHNQVNDVGGSPVVLRGLTSDGKSAAEIEREVAGIKVETAATCHDGEQGARRGKNAVFILELDGLRVVHLGDLGHRLSSAQVEAIGPVDVLLIPVGGIYTIAGDSAHAVVEQLQPRLAVIPMHFKTPSAEFLEFSAEDFAAGRSPVLRPGGDTWRLDLDDPPRVKTYVVLEKR